VLPRQHHPWESDRFEKMAVWISATLALAFGLLFALAVAAQAGAV
jgi:hypothetical protein